MTIEIEKKIYLGSEAAADKFRLDLEALGAEFVGKTAQLNHYFKGDRLKDLTLTLSDFLGYDDDKFLVETAIAGGYHVRTRQISKAFEPEQNILIVKAGKDPANGSIRREFEKVIDLSLPDLDAKILEAGFEYEAKWSRDRETFKKNIYTITIDRNAGYGYIAEVEIIVTDELMESSPASLGLSCEQVASIAIDSLISRMSLTELPSDRLQRMFEHYNKNWREYYGTDKIFVVE